MQDLTPHVRVLDTRKTKQPLAAGETRKVAVSYGGKAALIRVATIGTAGPGYLQVFASATPGDTSECNIALNEVQSDLVRVAMFDGGWVNVRATAPCHLIIDTQAVAQ